MLQQSRYNCTNPPNVTSGEEPADEDWHWKVAEVRHCERTEHFIEKCFILYKEASLSRMHTLIKCCLFQLQGALLLASLIQVFIGMSGIVGFLMKFLGPLSIAPSIVLTGVYLFNFTKECVVSHQLPLLLQRESSLEACSNRCSIASSQWWVTLGCLFTIVLLAMFLKDCEYKTCWCESGKCKDCISCFIPVLRMLAVTDASMCMHMYHQLTL